MTDNIEDIDDADSTDSDPLELARLHAERARKLVHDGEPRSLTGLFVLVLLELSDAMLLRMVESNSEGDRE